MKYSSLYFSVLIKLSASVFNTYKYDPALNVGMLLQTFITCMFEKTFFYVQNVRTF